MMLICLYRFCYDDQSDTWTSQVPGRPVHIVYRLGSHATQGPSNVNGNNASCMLVGGGACPLLGMDPTPIFCVEDEPATLPRMLHILKKRCSRILVTKNGADGLKTYLQYKLRIAITDIFMAPVIPDGLWFIPLREHA